MLSFYERLAAGEFNYVGSNEPDARAEAPIEEVLCCFPAEEDPSDRRDRIARKIAADKYHPSYLNGLSYEQWDIDEGDYSWSWQ